MMRWSGKKFYVWAQVVSPFPAGQGMAQGQQPDQLDLQSNGDRRREAAREMPGADLPRSASALKDV